MRSSSDSSTRNGASYVASMMGRDDSRVVKALEDYLDAAERGQAPNRNEFLLRHASIADRLAPCLDGLDVLRSAAGGFATGSFRPSDHGGVPALATGGRLGDYQILREVGRGGMGVVYEALQLSLGRRVALKVLPAALAVDPRQLQRFRVEARAAAQLHHSNIVPVFAVDCHDNVHYYAMQFIEGPTLAQVIRALREQNDTSKLLAMSDARSSNNDSRLHALLDDGDPGPGKAAATVESPSSSTANSTASAVDVLGEGSRYRMVARLGVQAARALDHAHRLGVVHRDIKPANLMLDARGNLWITDFGLARMQEDAGLTITGDLLGTLRYMSPEQASGRRTVIDHRADIYSLGTTLYELLTWTPAVSGRDRQDLIRQIVQDDPVRPRRVDGHIPRELETIVLKAMAKEPADRYATANDLADDLQRYLDDKPIHARAPTLIDRGAKFARRHKSVFVGACILLMFAAAFFAASTIHVSQRLREVEQQRRGAVQKFKLARRSIDALYEQIEAQRVLDPTGFGSDYHGLMQTVLNYYRDFAKDGADDAELLTERALAFHRIGDIQFVLGHPDEAETAYRRGLAILERLSADPRSDSSALAEHAAQVCKSLGRLLHTTIRDAEAEELMRRAIVYQTRFLREGQVVNPVKANRFLSNLYLDLGRVEQLTGKYDEAIFQFHKALELARVVAATNLHVTDRVEAEALADSIQSFLLQAKDDMPGAIDHARRAIAALEWVHKQQRSRLEPRSQLAQGYFRLAYLLGTTSNEELRDLDEALELADKAVTLEKYNASYHQQRGALLMAMAPFDQERRREFYRDAEREFRTVLWLVPDSPDAHNSLAWILATYENAKDRRPQVAVQLASKAVHDAPQVGLYWNTLGVAYYANGEYQRAIAALERSMELRDGGDSFDWYPMALAQWSLGRDKDARYWFNRATSWMLRFRKHDADLARFHQVAKAAIIDTPVRGLTSRSARAQVLGTVQSEIIASNRTPPVAVTSSEASRPAQGTVQSVRTQSQRERKKSSDAKAKKADVSPEPPQSDAQAKMTKTAANASAPRSVRASQSVATPVGRPGSIRVRTPVRTFENLSNPAGPR